MLRPVTKKDIKKIVALEAAIYPEFMQYMQDIRTKKDIKEYCEDTKVSVALGEDWYLIVTQDEVVDLATASRLPLSTLNGIFNALKAHFGERVFTLDARASTSYRIISVYEKRGKLKIHSSSEWYWEDELMYELELSLQEV